MYQDLIKQANRKPNLVGKHHTHPTKSTKNLHIERNMEEKNVSAQTHFIEQDSGDEKKRS